MSPASQGALEVERYIGSCLISSNVRQGGTASSGQHKPIVGKKQQEQTIRGKAVATRGCYASQSYVNGGNEQQCQLPYGTGSGWTGAPLISMTSSPRRCNQRSSPSLGQQQQQQLQQQPPQQSQQQQQQQQQQPCEQQVPGHLHKSPLSRLAIHTHGAPLILAGRFHNRAKIHNSSNGVANPACNGNSTTGNFVHGGGGNASTPNVNVPNGGASRCPPSRAPRPAIEPAKKPQTSPKSDCSPAVTGKETAGASIANIDSLSIASDESSGSNNSENSLPRIIKPRKRRKKERKPPNNVATGVDVAKHPDEQQFQQQAQNQQQQQQLQHLQQSQQQQQQQQISLNQNISSEQSSIVTLKPYAPSCYEQQQRYEPAAPPHLRSHRRPPMVREGLYGCRLQSGTGSSIQEIADVRQRYAHRHVQVKALDDNRNVVMPAPMRAMPHPKAYRHVNGHHHHHHHHHHNGGNGSVPRYIQHEYSEHATACEDIRDGLGTCQCRYCDPSGLIWDVDQNGYSPFLTPPPSDYCHGQYTQLPLFLSRPSLACQQEHQQHQHQVHQQQQQQAVDRLFDVDNSRLRHERESCNSGSGVILRRSWSDPTSYFSDEITAPSKDVGVIGDRGGQPSDSGKRRTLWRGDTLGAPTSMLASSSASVNGGVGGVSPSSPKGLEVSTEIVTSPNGHRDLEIKFYSSPSAPVNPLEEDKSIFTDELVDDGEEDFSDLWSYHESKLQQDFRTLLQAEE